MAHNENTEGKGANFVYNYITRQAMICCSRPGSVQRSS